MARAGVLVKRGAPWLGLLAVLGLALVVAAWLTRVPEPNVGASAPAPDLSRGVSGEPGRPVARVDAPPARPRPGVLAPLRDQPSAVQALTPPTTPVGAAEPDAAASTSPGGPGGDAGLAPFTIDGKGIRAAVASRMTDIAECYEAWLKQNPKLAGHMVVGFLITSDDAGTGEVTHVELLDGGLGQPFMEGCVLNAFQDIRFSQPEGGGQVLVHYPLHFESSDDADAGR